MKDISNRAVLALLVATIVVSIGGTFVTLNALDNRLGVGMPQVTGFVIVPNATATVTVNTYSSIKFSEASVAFGTGSVNTSAGNNCTLSTLDGTNGLNSGCLDFSEVANGFTIENDGNTNLSVELKSNRSATQFIGIGSALFLWNVTVNETGSCKNTTVSTNPENSVNPNTTVECGGVTTTGANCGSIFENVSDTYKNICPRLLFADSSDALNIDINISIPSDAPAGAKMAGLVVTGTRHPTS